MTIEGFQAINGLWSMLKKGKFIKDSAALGVTGGLMGAIAMALSNFMIYKAGKTEILYGHIAGSIFMRPMRTRQRKNYILGQIFHLFNGSGVGIFMVKLFKWMGTDLPVLKGALVGMFSWEVLYNVGQRLGIYTAKPHLTKTGYSALWNNFLFGVVTAYSIKWLAHPSVFQAVNRQKIKRRQHIPDNQGEFYREESMEDERRNIIAH